MLRAAIVIAVALMTVPAYAQAPYPQVLRCVDADGKVEYRSSPCPADAREQVVGAQNATQEANAAVPHPGLQRRTNISQERRSALDAAERNAAVARAARPQVAVQVLPLPPAK
jgi:hypothetical protein